VECRLPENHKSCRSNNQVRIKFIVDKKPCHGVQECCNAECKKQGQTGGGPRSAFISLRGGQPQYNNQS